MLILQTDGGDAIHRCPDLQSVRLRYAGFVAFSAQLFSLVTGALFTLMVTRRLNEAAFASWLLINNFAWYFVFPSNIVGYWVTRYEARGIAAAKTGLVMNFAFGCFSLVPYLVASTFVSGVADIPYQYFVTMSLFVVFFYLLVALGSVAKATQPESLSQSSIFFELAKVGLGFLLLLVWRLQLAGAIATLVVAYPLQFLALRALVHRRLGGRFDSQLARRILRHLWIPLLGAAATFFMGTPDYLVVTFLTSVGTATLSQQAAVEFSKRVLATYGAAYIVGVVVTYSSSLAIAVYPRLLGGGGSKDVEESLRMVSTFAVPMCIGAIILARPIVGLLNPVYAASYPVIFALAIAGLLSAVSAPYDWVILGTEKVELREEATFQDFIKSRLFLSPAIVFSAYVLRLLMLFVGFLCLPNIVEGGVLVAALFWSLTYLFSWILVAVGRWRLARKALPTVFPWRSFLNVLAACAVMSVVALLFSGMPVLVESSEALAALLPVILASAGTYFAVLYALDGWFRSIVARALSFLTSLLRRGS